MAPQFTATKGPQNVARRCEWHEQTALAGAGFTVDQHWDLLRREYLRLRFERQHALALRHDAVERCIYRCVEPGELDQLVGADGIGSRDILGRDLKRHFDLLNALL